MIIKNGEIIAIGKVKHDNTLSGTGQPESPLGISETVKQVIENKQNKLTPADNTIAISNDQIKVNTSGISAQQIHPSVFEPYALSADVRREFDASAAWVNERFDNIPAAEAYSGGNGIKVIGHEINLTADVVSHNELKQASAAAVNSATAWVTDQHYLKEADLSNYATKEYAREASAAAVSTTKDWVEGKGYLTSESLEPYAKTSDVNAQFNATSAWANATFQQRGDYVSATDFEEYKNQVEQDLEDINTSLNDKLNKSDFDTYSAKTVDDFRNISASLDDKLNRSETTEWDITEYSAGSGLKIQNHKIEVSADYVLNSFLEDNYYDKNTIDDKLSKLGGYKVVNGKPNTHEPDYEGADKEKYIFLTQDPDATGLDVFFEWIWFNNAWKCIGETSLDLSGYATDEELQTAIDNLSATYLKKEDFHDTTYTEGPNIHIYGNDNTISGRDWTPELDEKADTTVVEQIAETLANEIVKKLDTSAFNDYSAHALDDYYKKSETSAKEEIQSALDEKQDNLTEEQLSAISSVSAIQAISGNWVTSATNVITDPGLAYFLIKNGDTSKWNGVDLSTLGKTYDVLSIDDDLLKITSSVDGNNTTYTLSAKDWSNELEEKVDETIFNEELQDIAEQFVDLSATVSSDYVKKGEIPEPVFYDISAKYAMAQSGTYNDKDYYFISGAEIIGNNGVSAEYDPTTNSWEVGLEDQTYTYAEAQTLLTTLTASTEALSGYTNIVKYGNGIDIDSTDITLDTGLYHVDIQVNIPVETVSNNTYSVSLTSNLSNAIVTHDIDASYIHTETFDLSFDVNALQNSNDLVFSISGLPVGYKYIVKNLQIHQIVTTDTVLDVAGHIYGAGSAVLIDNQYNINVNYDETSGIGLNENNQLVVKLGKGLKFEEGGEVAGTLTLDNITEEVVETVTELQAELNGKLTTNFPYPMITDNNTDFANYKGAGDNCICQLFSVSLNHKITTDTYFTVYMKDNGYSQANVIFGIFEYNFDYWDETTQRWRGQTNWVCDTGPVNLNKPTKDYKLEFPVTHINSAHNVLRSDRAYYAVLALKSDGGSGVFLACTDNYNGDVHSEPTLNWRWQSVPNLDFINASGTLENTYWWDPTVNNYDEKADMRRFFLQIRNKVQPTSTPNP